MDNKPYEERRPEKSSLVKGLALVVVIATSALSVSCYVSDGGGYHPSPVFGGHYGGPVHHGGHFGGHHGRPHR